MAIQESQCSHFIFHCIFIFSTVFIFHNALSFMKHNTFYYIINLFSIQTIDYDYTFRLPVTILFFFITFTIPNFMISLPVSV